MCGGSIFPMMHKHLQQHRQLSISKIAKSVQFLFQNYKKISLNEYLVTAVEPRPGRFFVRNISSYVFASNLQSSLW